MSFPNQVKRSSFGDLFLEDLGSISVRSAVFAPYFKLTQLLLRHDAEIHLQDCATWYAATHYGVSRGDGADLFRLQLANSMDVRRMLRDYGAVLYSCMTVQEIDMLWFEGIVDTQMAIIIIVLRYWSMLNVQSDKANF